MDMQAGAASEPISKMYGGDTAARFTERHERPEFSSVRTVTGRVMGIVCRWGNVLFEVAPSPEAAVKVARNDCGMLGGAELVRLLVRRRERLFPLPDCTLPLFTLAIGRISSGHFHVDSREQHGTPDRPVFHEQERDPSVCRVINSPQWSTSAYHLSSEWVSVKWRNK
ncbi:hypothetical protein GEV33_010604 [Tenebrio molitor]|uniref:Uncharacterized protein n=1 Tax=Tenebrio molitor TaxID=7067 RepID=A0A8J6HD30_TENMO|nr:hypothetical protein GEV33_010604 [Tenebrio molitor]